MKNDTLIVNAAFSAVSNLELMYGDDIPWNAIEKGFNYEGEKVFLAGKAIGIFKPKQMSRGVLSIKTTMPREGRVNIYNDEKYDNGCFRYSLQKGDPQGGGNKYLWEALEDKSPFIYFYPVAPAVYKALWPCFVISIDSDGMFCEVVIGRQSKLLGIQKKEVIYQVPTEIEREYHVAESRARIHQAAFRELVLNAYNYRCAITGLPVVALLEAAHITPDVDPKGDAIVTNGLSLSRIHHRAYDANLLGIDPDCMIHISEKLLNISDGVLLEKGLKEFQGKKIELPRNKNFFPDRYRLDERFSRYLMEQ